MSHLRQCLKQDSENHQTKNPGDTQMKILVVEDDPVASEVLEDDLVGVGYEVMSASTGEDARELIDSSNFDVIVTDVRLPGISGIELARSVIDSQKVPPRFILISGDDNVIANGGILGLDLGDFLPKPLNLKHLLAALRRIYRDRSRIADSSAAELERHLAANSRIAIRELPEPLSLLESDQTPFIGVYGPAMFAVCERLRRVAPFPEIAVLVEGETGTGKELVARYVSMVDQTNEGPFVAINCSLFNSELFAAELFGYERGTFTGADQHGKKGKLDLASDGCLFLDEITEISADLQARFLRVLQERNYYRLGGDALIDAKCRFILATNRDIVKLVDQGLFRQDLYFRLSICHIHIPPLRDRKEEIHPLAVRFMKSISGSWLKARHVETAAFGLLERFSWPGNTRQLQNVISSWGLFESGDTLTAATLAGILEAQSAQSSAIPVAKDPTKGKTFSIGDFDSVEIPDKPFNLAELDEAIVRKTLRKFDGNKLKTAKFLGISRSQLYRRYLEP